IALSFSSLLLHFLFSFCFFFSFILYHPRSTLFPYTTLFRSLLNKNTKDTRDHSRVFCYFKWFCPLSWKTESRANFDFAEYGFRYEKHNGQNKKDKGLRWRFFSAAF